MRLAAFALVTSLTAVLASGCDPIVDYRINNGSTETILVRAFHEPCSEAQDLAATTQDGWDVVSPGETFWQQYIGTARCIVLTRNDRQVIGSEAYRFGLVFEMLPDLSYRLVARDSDVRGDRSSLDITRLVTIIFMLGAGGLALVITVRHFYRYYVSKTIT